MLRVVSFNFLKVSWPIQLIKGLCLSGEILLSSCQTVTENATAYGHPPVAVRFRMAARAPLSWV